MRIEWLNAELTRAKVTVEATDSHWWRRRYIVAEVERTEPKQDRGIHVFRSYADWRFVVGGNRVVDHDDSLAHAIDEAFHDEKRQRAAAAKRAQLKNPWAEADSPPRDPR